MGNWDNILSASYESRSPQSSRFLVIIGSILLFTLLGWLFYLHSFYNENTELSFWLRNRGKIAVIGSNDLSKLNPPGTELVDVSSIPALKYSLERRDVVDLNRAISSLNVDGLLVDGQMNRQVLQGDSLRNRLLRYDHVDGLKGKFLMSKAALYVPSPVINLSTTSRTALAGVARGILNSSRPPRIHSFPEPLRRLRHTEIMVRIRKCTRDRLWRSAKGNSIAKALITASVIARKRWKEREQMMGGKLNDLLPELDVEVYYLLDDGTIVDRDPHFINSVFKDVHSMAYEWKGRWRFQPPDTGSISDFASATEAYHALFKKYGLPKSSLQRGDIRLYRLAVSLLTRSTAPSSSQSVHYKSD